MPIESASNSAETRGFARGIVYGTRLELQAEMGSSVHQKNRDFSRFDDRLSEAAEDDLARPPVSIGVPPLRPHS
jgi:hypothetical protein